MFDEGAADSQYVFIKGGQFPYSANPEQTLIGLSVGPPVQDGFLYKFAITVTDKTKLKAGQGPYAILVTDRNGAVAEASITVKKPASTP